MEKDILEAAWLELADHGWTGLQMERVAARAGTGKASLYARWPDKHSLVRAAMVHAASTMRQDFEPTDSLETDLRQILLGNAAVLAGPFGEAYRGMVSGISPSAESSGTMFNDDLPIEPVAIAVRAAQDAGRLEPGVIPPRIINLGLTVSGHYFLVNGTPPSEEVVDEVISRMWMPLLATARVSS